MTREDREDELQTGYQSVEHCAVLQEASEENVAGHRRRGSKSSSHLCQDSIDVAVARNPLMHLQLVNPQARSVRTGTSAEVPQNECPKYWTASAKTLWTTKQITKDRAVAAVHGSMDVMFRCYTLT